LIVKSREEQQFGGRKVGQMRKHNNNNEKVSLQVNFVRFDSLAVMVVIEFERIMKVCPNET
jgi:hypothetical protein